MGCGDSKNAAAAAAAMSSSPGFLNIEDVYSGGSAARSSESGTEIQEAFQDGRFVRPEIGFVVKCFPTMQLELIAAAAVWWCIESVL